MFSFFSNIKTRLEAVEGKVEAILTHIHTELAGKVVAAEAAPAKVAEAVEAEVTEAPKAVVADVAAAVESKV